MSEVIAGVDVGAILARDLAAEAIQAMRAALDWIDALPSSVVLPAMPGFDRDWYSEVMDALTEQQAAREQDQATIDRLTRERDEARAELARMAAALKASFVKMREKESFSDDEYRRMKKAFEPIEDRMYQDGLSDGLAQAQAVLCAMFYGDAERPAEPAAQNAEQAEASAATRGKGARDDIRD